MLTSELPKVARQGRYTIKDTAAILGIHVNTLRHYTQGGLITASYRRGTCRKFYLGENIIRFYEAEMGTTPRTHKSTTQQQ